MATPSIRSTARSRRLVLSLVVFALSCVPTAEGPSRPAASRCTVSAVGSHDSPAFDGLRALALKGIDDAALARLGQHAPALVRLELRGSRLADLGPLAAFDRLETVVLERVAGNDLSALARLETLQHLDLTLGSARGPADLSVLGRLPRLEVLRLVLVEPRTMAEALRALPAMPRLRHFSVVGTCGDGFDLRSLGSSPRLSEIALETSRCYDVSLDGLQGSAVSALAMSGIRVRSFEPLVDAPALRRLALMKPRGTYDDGINVWTVPAFPRPLQSFYLGHAPERAPDDFGALGRLKQLRVLEIEDAMTYDLSFLHHLQGLRELSIATTKVVDPSALLATSACSVAFEASTIMTTGTNDEWATTAHAQRAIHRIEAFFAQRACPAHCDQRCSTRIHGLWAESR